MGTGASSSERLYQPVNDQEGVPHDGEEQKFGGDVEGHSFRSQSSERKRMKINGIDLRWHKVSYSVPGKKSGTTKQILFDCSGNVAKGEMCCIMGPSGAGKTTMMNILAGRVSAPFSGSVLANGQAVNPAKFAKNIAYVMQEEALFATATPREALHFSAAMRLPQNTSIEERNELVEGLLMDLDLTKCADTLIGSVLIQGISGGEKKRTSIGVELITQPKIIFLDEPTSGLDTYSAFNACEILKKLCKRGCSVVCTIHQPSSEIFHLFDKTLLIQSGYIVYHGAVNDMPAYFDSLGEKYACPPNYNPADHVMFLMQAKEKHKGDHSFMRESWAKREAEHKEDILPPDLKREASFMVEYRTKAGICRQFAYLLTREVRNTFRDRKTLIARFGLTTFLHTLYGLVFKGVGASDDYNSRYGALLQLCVAAMFGCAQPMILNFPFERPVFIREYIAGSYNVAPYFLSKAMMEIPLAMSQTLVGLMLGYFLIELKGNFFRLWMGLFLLGIVSSSVAILLGCATSNVKAALETTPIIFVPQMLFAGMVPENFPKRLDYLLSKRKNYFKDSSSLSPPFQCTYDGPSGCARLSTRSTSWSLRNSPRITLK
uniref:ABC transporter domain-containing protein n=1 Tax=Lotharella globosa TaxID=91324 RepID=A0A7S3YF66_9EUKA